MQGSTKSFLWSLQLKFRQDDYSSTCSVLSLFLILSRQSLLAHMLTQNHYSWPSINRAHLYNCTVRHLHLTAVFLDKVVSLPLVGSCCLSASSFHCLISLSVSEESSATTIHQRPDFRPQNLPERSNPKAWRDPLSHVTCCNNVTSREVHSQVLSHNQQILGQVQVQNFESHVLNTPFIVCSVYWQTHLLPAHDWLLGDWFKVYPLAGKSTDVQNN